MPEPRRNRAREHRIEQEIVVDAYTSDERALGWYYYLRGRLAIVTVEPGRVRVHLPAKEDEPK